MLGHQTGFLGSGLNGQRPTATQTITLYPNTDLEELDHPDWSHIISWVF